MRLFGKKKDKQPEALPEPQVDLPEGVRSFVEKYTKVKETNEALASTLEQEMKRRLINELVIANEMDESQLGLLDEVVFAISLEDATSREPAWCVHLERDKGDDKYGRHFEGIFPDSLSKLIEKFEQKGLEAEKTNHPPTYSSWGGIVKEAKKAL